MYLRGLSTSDFHSALEGLLDKDTTAGLSQSVIVSLKRVWEREHEEWKTRAISERFADGIHLSIRFGEDSRLCLLVLIGVAENGEKKLLAVDAGYRKSAGSWKALEQFEPPGTPGTGRDAVQGKRDFVHEFHAKYPKAVEKLEKNWKELTAFFSLPALHWQSLRTTNVIESTFATVRLRTKRHQGRGLTEAPARRREKLASDPRLRGAHERFERGRLELVSQSLQLANWIAAGADGFPPRLLCGRFVL